MINLKGMTWDHSRGYDPMVATSKKFQEIYNFEHTPHPIEFEMYYSG